MNMRYTVGQSSYGISFGNQQTVRSHLVFGGAVLAELRQTHCWSQNRWHQPVAENKQAEYKIKMSNKIGSSRFRFDESVLTGIEFGFQIVWNMLMMTDSTFGKVLRI